MPAPGAALLRGEPVGEPRTRLWEVDALRALAVVMMVTYHAAYDVNMLAEDVGVNPYDGAWRALQIATGSTFLALVGVSYWISHQRARAGGLAGLALWRSRAGRARDVLLGALAVTLGTLIAMGPDDYVRFGILHLIGTAMLIVLPLAVRFGAWNAAVGAAVIGLGFVVQEVSSDLPGALVLGFAPDESGVDWYPLLPWGGVSLIGLAIGAVLYPDGHRSTTLRRLLPRPPRLPRIVGALGRHSLPFYLVHQPVLIVLAAGALTLAGTEVDW